MRIAIIGAGQGLGKILGQMLKERGHEVVCGFRNQKSDHWTQKYGILSLPMDVTNEAELQAAAAVVKKEFGELDAVVDVAGILLESDRNQTLRYTVDDVEILAVHPGRMNTVMGRTTAQIEPQEAAVGFCRILEGEIPTDGSKCWFIDYLGNEMPL